MPSSPNLPTNVADQSAGHLTHTNAVHSAVNSFYKVAIGTTRTAAFTLTQSHSGEIIPVNVSSSIAVTVPILEQGTVVELARIGTAGFTLTASGVTFVPAAGTPRALGSVVSLVWLTTTSVLVGGDLA